MQGFNFEKNLAHQERAVLSTLAVFEHLEAQELADVDKHCMNPVYNRVEKPGKVFDHIIQPFGQYSRNIRARQADNGIDEKPNPKSNIIDIMMETGTGKTYTYTKTMFELNKRYGIFKFVVVVPTLSIKAGTMNFMKSDSSREHFKEQYGKMLTLHVVESQKSNKKKSAMPPVVEHFVKAGNFEKNALHVLIINAGMINADTMQTSGHRTLFDRYSVPLDAIAAVKPFMIIDEPHKFGQENKTWENIQKMRPQFILRYGATFPEKEISQINPLTRKAEKIAVKDYHNLVYQLTAVDSFNNNLVKGIIGHITEFESGKNAVVKFLDSDGTEAEFELLENNQRTTTRIAKKESLSKIHPAMTDLGIEHLNKSTAVLSNGLEMKKGDSINPYSFAEKLQETIIQKAIKHHFELEKSLLTREVRIKPLTLFFIDNINEYRNKDGYIRKTVEQYAKAEIEALLKAGTDAVYASYLEKTLLDLSATHGGYFSKDNTEKDEAIEKEIHEILHDKQALLDLENPRRFIFSKWTLREGWDNPNVFQICKLRTSGSEISKLQEVGRGLRLPVNEYGNRVKDEQFYLNYFVDFTESDFVEKLVNEINQKSGAISREQMPEKLSEQMIKKICDNYQTNEDELLEVLDANNVITRTNIFKPNGFEFIKQNYPQIFEGVGSNKIRKQTDTKKSLVVRTEKYHELKELWEKLNEKVILEYKFSNEAAFQQLCTEFLKTQKGKFILDGIHERIATVEMINNSAVVNETESLYNRTTESVSIMQYSDFLKELARDLHINIKTLHQSMIDAEVDINTHLSQSTLRVLKQNFDHFLMANAIDKFSIEYKQVSNTIHPTKLTDEQGNVRTEIAASDVGVLFSEEKVAKSYFFEELYYDSDLEKSNIKTEIDEVIVFTKIPKNSIKIPVAGGKSYSPDFAYVVKFKGGKQKLHFIVETKNVPNENTLREEEKSKIKHAEKFFGKALNITFKTQFTNNRIVDLITEIME
ncbi:MAG: type III restriction-modification system endonuclease [Candidatus Kapaibacteriota bacterium]